MDQKYKPQLRNQQFPFVLGNGSHNIQRKGESEYEDLGTQYGPPTVEPRRQRGQMFQELVEEVT